MIPAPHPSHEPNPICGAAHTLKGGNFDELLIGGWSLEVFQHSVLPE